MAANNYRKVTDVYKQILPIIPQDKNILRNELKEYIDSLWNIAPEELSSGYFWKPFIDILNSNIFEIKEDWEQNIKTILLNEQ